MQILEFNETKEVYDPSYDIYHALDTGYSEDDAIKCFANSDRTELHDGNLVYKFLPHPRHNWFQTRLFSQLNDYKNRQAASEPKWIILSEPKVLYPKMQNGFIHDLAGWRSDRMPKLPDTQIITLVPDWVCEVLSSNVKNDRGTKMQVLHKHGVKYYWIADWRNKTMEVFEWREHHYDNVQFVTMTGEEGETTWLPPFDFPIMTRFLFEC
jgi:Uma2 family endonuclease